jgi:hypothetical protein
MSSHQEWLDLLVIGKNPCKKCRSKGRDRSGDNFHFYGEGQGGYCNACGYTLPSDDVLKENDKYHSTKKTRPKFEECEIKVMAKEFNEDDWDELTEVSTFDPDGFRGLKESTCEHYQVLHTYSEKTGKIEGQWYPCTEGGILTGCKSRKLPKKFFFQGKTGNQIDLFGQWVYTNSNSKWVVITGGELDALSGHQILEDHKKKGFETIPVVSPTNGETGSDKQLKNHYEWFNTFEKIFLCYDNDAAGIEATDKAVKVLPKGKVYIIKMARKDVNEYIWDNDKSKAVNYSQEWYNAFWRAEKYVPAGVTSSDKLEEAMRDYLKTERLSLPPFMEEAEKMLAGGFPFPSVVNLLGASGVGKSTIVDACTKHWIMEDSRLVGIVSLEASEGEYGVNLASSYCGFKVNKLATVKERLEWLDKPENVERRKKLWSDEKGDPRFYIVDADIENMKSKIEFLVISMGCKIVILDPLQDIFDMLPDDEQAKWMKWEKDLAKQHKLCIINISHSRKNGSGQKSGSKGAELDEEDMMGHSSIYKSGHINIVVWRNKEDEDVEEKNTTYVKISKARGVGDTGYAGTFKYDNNTHRLAKGEKKAPTKQSKKEEAYSPKKFTMNKGTTD